MIDISASPSPVRNIARRNAFVNESSQSSTQTQAESSQGTHINASGSSRSLDELSQCTGHSGSTRSNVVSSMKSFCSRMGPADLSKLTESDYKTMTVGRMAMVAGLASRELNKTLRKNKELQDEKKKLKRAASLQSKSLEKQLRLMDNTVISSMELQTSGKSGKRLTCQSMIALGLRRNMSNIAAGDFGALILRDMSAATVIRAEVRTGAVIAASMKSFCSDALASARLHSPFNREQAILANLSSCDDEWQLQIVSFRSDATNSQIWRREKLHVLEVEMAYVAQSLQPPQGHTLDKMLDMKWLERRKCLNLALCLATSFLLSLLVVVHRSSSGGTSKFS